MSNTILGRLRQAAKDTKNYRRKQRQTDKAEGLNAHDKKRIKAYRRKLKERQRSYEARINKSEGLNANDKKRLIKYWKSRWTK